MISAMRVFRVQDADGRGPWRPGLSRVWIDVESDAGPLTEHLLDVVSMNQLAEVPADMTVGSACVSLEQLGTWFTSIERLRLQKLGFNIVALSADVIVGSGQHQVVFARKRPFHLGASRVSWSRLPGVVPTQTRG